MINTDNNGGSMVMPVQPMGGGYGGGYGYGYPTVPAVPVAGGFGSGFGGYGGGDFLYLLLFLCLFGGGYGFGGMGGMGGGLGMMYPWMLANGINQNVDRGFDNSSLEAAVNANGSAIQSASAAAQQAICQSTAGINQNIFNGFANAESAAAARQMASLERSFAAQTAVDARLDSLAMGQQNCCCENRERIADLKYTVATENCADRAAASENTRDILEAIGSKTQTVLDKLCQLELDGVRQNYENRIAGLENALSQSRASEQSLRFAASQANQNAQFAQTQNAAVSSLLNELRSCPIPAQPVYGSQPIFTCPNQQNPSCGCGYGYAA